MHEFLGYHWRLPDPSVSNHPEELLEPFPINYSQIYSSPMDFTSTLDALEPYLRKLDEEEVEHLERRYRHTVPMEVGQYRAVISFDLKKSVSELLREAEHFLKFVQKYEVGETPPTKRKQPMKWLAYLRTLDAREVGASWSEIAAIHPNTAQTPQTARDIWKAANALRNNF
ncbi:hypothetical protein [Cognatishimia sp. F0-27]|uniref:hypothetical protein n=1 Tax=Cognatishimia sp. F0-27 TaxID=2816855 RepID=UPI001D0C2B91|nr:hypothetical protein [Cognatishimia sp. F0-27]MCC1493702.1 hypothetical protein [Cognatishimia sp. F0-27]